MRFKIHYVYPNTPGVDSEMKFFEVTGDTIEDVMRSTQGVMNEKGLDEDKHSMFVEEIDGDHRVRNKGTPWELASVAERLGFKDVAELHRMVADVDLSTSDKLEKFRNWKLDDGTKEGLLELKE